MFSASEKVYRLLVSVNHAIILVFSESEKVILLAQKLRCLTETILDFRENLKSKIQNLKLIDHFNHRLRFQLTNLPAVVAAEENSRIDVNIPQQ
ncbi:hypothetical protein NIES22_24010 [Calothrix brevissima NIES-22]|nr:hypothetical protein NIES22_24010 [Calothrix brevissima NIES-22]